MLTEFSLAGKRALITGGSTGLGRAMGLVFAEAGADVALCARTVENLKEAEQEIGRHGHKVVSIATDVSDSARLMQWSSKPAKSWAASTFSSTTPVG